RSVGIRGSTRSRSGPSSASTSRSDPLGRTRTLRRNPPSAGYVGLLGGRLAVLSLHSSPLAQPGTGDSGGMNVYVRELVSALAQAGVNSDVYTRRWASDLPDVVEVEPGFRVVHVPAGAPDLPKEALPEIVDEFTDGVLGHLTSRTDMAAAARHAHYC